ncbi:hypothetical protein AQPE_2630 [Aquipluma nitroreducens]|uniref:Uncharacterized protein n=1 Tax=Aquipluma nitroreducens TaxID=2010828 RepID=A0A5K7SA58_9BACT|nr:hypothetical protein AQPE_2630 [Aquipluma nitroreducens]
MARPFVVGDAQIKQFFRLNQCEKMQVFTLPELKGIWIILHHNQF